MSNTDESRLQQLDDAIAALRREERAEMALRAEEDRRRAAFDAHRGQLEKLERQHAELSARILEQQTHIRVTAEQELLRDRAARLDDEITSLREKLAAAETARVKYQQELGEARH